MWQTDDRDKNQSALFYVLRDEPVRFRDDFVFAQQPSAFAARHGHQEN